jgi:hypothetical protein
MMAGGLMATLLSFGATIVLDVLNAVYVCFALDKDRACVTRPEVHAIYVLLPSRCALENPALTRKGLARSVLTQGDPLPMFCVRPV